MISEKVQVATTMRPKVAMLTSGMDRSVVAMKRDNARGARGAGHPLYDPFIVANRQRDEPLGCSGGRQPSSGGTSRMTGDRLVRICEGSRVKFLRSTRQSSPHGLNFCALHRLRCGQPLIERGTIQLVAQIVLVAFDVSSHS